MWKEEIQYYYNLEYLITFPICHRSNFSLNKKEFIEGRGKVLTIFFLLKEGEKMEGENVQSTISKEGTSLIKWTTKLADLKKKNNNNNNEIPTNKKGKRLLISFTVYFIGPLNVESKSSVLLFLLHHILYK